MKLLIIILILLSPVTVCCQYASIDTLFWKHNAGYRTELLSFDSILVEGIVKSAEICGCDTIVDFLHRSYGELKKYDGFFNGFSDEIRNYAFKLSLTNSECLTEVLDNYDAKSKYQYLDPDDRIHLSNYTFLKEMISHRETYFPVLVKLLIETNYKFKHQNSSEVNLRKNIALLLDEVARSISLSQLASLDKERRDYLSSLVLSKESINKVKDPLSKFPE